MSAARIRVLPAHDIRDAVALLKQSKPKVLVADKAYDAAWLHEYCLENNIKAHIPIRDYGKPRFHRWDARHKAIQYFKLRTYHRREIVESGNHSIKQAMGSSVSSKNVRTIRTEIYGRLACHNIFYWFFGDSGLIRLLGNCTYEDIKDYIDSFYLIIYTKDKRRKADFKKFFDMVHAATNSKKNIEGRRKILLDYFKERFDVHLKDEQRIYNQNDRKRIYDRTSGRCQYKHCPDRKIDRNAKFEIHHKKLYAGGSKTDYRNAILVHPECHRAIHKNMKLKRIK